MYQPQFKAVYVAVLLLVLFLISTNKIVLLILILFFYGEMFELIFSCKNDWTKNYPEEEDDDLEDYPNYDVSMLYITEDVVSQWESYDLEMDEDDEESQLSGMEALNYELDWDHPHINIPKQVEWMEVERESHSDFCFDLYIDSRLVKDLYSYNVKCVDLTGLHKRVTRPVKKCDKEFV